MRRPLAGWLPVAGLAVTLLTALLLAAPAQARTISVSPVTQTVTTGGGFTLQVYLDNAAGVAGFQFDLVYDGDLVSFTGGSPREGSLLAGRGWTLLCNQIDADTLRVLAYSPSLTALGPGAGTLTALDFTAGSTPGTTNVTLVGYTLCDHTGATLLPLAVAGGSVTVRRPAQAPIASFTYSPAGPTDREQVSFTDTSTDADGTIMAWDWNFGDGSAHSAVQHPSHQFPDDGTYTVSLTVTDSDGLTGTATRQVAVSNVPPAAAFTYSPAAPTTADTVQFTSACTDSDGTIAAYAWTFGDGGTATGQNPTHRYPDNGTYTVTLTATDDDGATASVTHSVAVANRAPTASFTFAPASPAPNQAVAFTDTSTDPDGTVVAWQWTFGDGASSSVRNPSHAYAAPGTYQVGLRVTDNDGSTGTTTRSLTVACGCNVTVKLSGPARPVAGKPGTLQVALTNTGTSGDNVTVVLERISPLPLATIGTQSVYLPSGKKGKATLTFSYTFRVADRPQATFRATATTGCGKVATAQLVLPVR